MRTLGEGPHLLVRLDWLPRRLPLHDHYVDGAGAEITGDGRNTGVRRSLAAPFAGVQRMRHASRLSFVEAPRLNWHAIRLEGLQRNRYSDGVQERNGRQLMAFSWASKTS
jgi:hypothetical protein